MHCAPCGYAPLFDDCETLTRYILTRESVKFMKLSKSTREKCALENIQYHFSRRRLYACRDYLTLYRHAVNDMLLRFVHINFTDNMLRLFFLRFFTFIFRPQQTADSCSSGLVQCKALLSFAPSSWVFSFKVASTNQPTSKPFCSFQTSRDEGFDRVLGKPGSAQCAINQ